MKNQPSPFTVIGHRPTLGSKALTVADPLRRLSVSLLALAVMVGPGVGQTLQHAAEVLSAQFSPDGRWVTTASKDYTARLWDAATGQSVGEPMKHQGVVKSAQFSPDSRRLVTASEDHTARLWAVAPR